MLPCYRIDPVLPAGVVVDELDEQSRRDDVDRADSFTEPVE